MKAEERKESIEIALSILREALVSTESSMAICDNRLIFFETQDYLETGDINKCPRFSVEIEKLVKWSELNIWIKREEKAKGSEDMILWY